MMVPGTFDWVGCPILKMEMGQMFVGYVSDNPNDPSKSGDYSGQHGFQFKLAQIAA